MLKVGIIGLGVGEAHLRAAHTHPDAQVVKACDLLPEKFTSGQEEFPKVSFTQNPHEVLEDPNINLVVIASYDNSHCEQILKGLAHEKHLFVEKPLCLTKEEARSIREAHNEKPHLQISSNLIMRRFPRFIDLKRQVEDGTLGKLFYLEGDYNYGRVHKITEGWRGKIPYYSVFLGGGVHLVDLFLWLTEDRVRSVHALGNKIATKDAVCPFDDFRVALLEFESGLVGKISSNFACVMPHFHPFRVYGNRGSFVNVSTERALLYRSRDPGEKPQEITSQYSNVDKGGLFIEFIEGLNSGGKAAVPIDSVFDAMSICFAVDESKELGRPVRVDYI